MSLNFFFAILVVILYLGREFGHRVELNPSTLKVIQNHFPGGVQV